MLYDSFHARALGLPARLGNLRREDVQHSIAQETCRRRRFPWRGSGVKRALWLGLVGAAALAIFLVLRAPARLLDRFLGDSLPIGLSRSAGTIWNGEADIAAGGHDLGRASWSFDPASLLQGTIGARWQVSGANHSLHGKAQASFAKTDVSLGGRVDAAFVNRLLSDYHIRLHGTFELDDVALTFADGPQPTTVQGTLGWNGGPTRYRLAGEIENATLPPMQAILSLNEAGHLQAEAFANNVPAPLIRTHLDPNGWLHIAISRRFTTLAGRPWPGTGPSGEMVVEVAQKLR